MRVVKAAPVLERVKDDIDRVFDRFFPAPFFAEPAFRTYEGTTPVWMPAFDLVETEKDYVIRLDAPGAHRENLDINLTANLLTIVGRRELPAAEKMENYLYREREWGKFTRTIRLPTDILADKIEATYHDGVLTVHLPKVPTAVANKIMIK
ncbi:MAG TPA: Hsp20/alpha crystallin family protein [Gemmatimonadales bacterium]|nr:Hsp20/alpha crystallin family protein [Gemmatimonadales bacterium]